MTCFTFYFGSCERSGNDSSTISESNLVSYYTICVKYMLGHFYLVGYHTVGSWAEHCKRTACLIIPRGILHIASFIFFQQQIPGRMLLWVNHDKIKGHNDELSCRPPSCAKFLSRICHVAVDLRTICKYHQTLCVKQHECRKSGKSPHTRMTRCSKLPHMQG